MSTAIVSPINPSLATPQPIGGANERPSSYRRRNALVPLPLLPPVPRNAIVTSVKIVHNPTPPSPTSPTDSANSSNPSSPEEDDVKVTSVANTERRALKRPSTSPTSPTQTNFYFAPLAKRPRHRRRSGSRSPKCSPPTSPTSPPGSRQYFPVVSESIKPAVPKAIKEEEEGKTEVENTEATAALRRPRSTILVTVRLASPPAQSTDTNPFDSLPPPPPPPSYLPPSPSLRHKKPLASLSARKPRLLSIQNRPQHNREPASPTLSRMKSPTSSNSSTGFGRQRSTAYVPPPPPPVPVKPKWNKPRVSSGLATTSPIVAHFEQLEAATGNVELEDVMSMDVDPSMPSLYPAGILRNTSSLNLTTPSRAVAPKKSKKGKTGSRLAMLRWALLNHSGPEVGRRIQAMGVRLAREIWEAERYAEEEEESSSGTIMLGRGTRQMSSVIVASPTREDSMVMESAKEDVESVLPSITDEDDAMPAIEEVMEHLDLVSGTETEKEERERIAEECIRELEEEMDIDEQEQQEEMEMVDPSLDRKMDNLTVSDSTIAENVDEGRALLEAAKAENNTKENSMAPTPIVVEDVEMFGENVSEATSLPSPSTQTTTANREILSFGRRASLATDKLNYAQDRLAELNGNHMRRRSSLGLTEDKMPIIMAARKWFGRAIL